MSEQAGTAADPLAALFLGELREAARQLNAFVEQDGPDGDDELGVAPDPLQEAVRSVNGASRVIGLSQVADLIDAVSRCLEECGTVANHDGRAARGKLRDARAYFERMARNPQHPAAFAAATAEEISILQLALAEPSRRQERRTGERVIMVDPTLLELFRQEAGACAAVLGERLVALDTQGPDSAVWEELMRATHSFKGAARIVDLRSVARLAHTLEECFVAAQSGALTLTSVDIDLLLLAVDVIATANVASADGLLASPDAVEAGARDVTPRLAELARRGPGTPAHSGNGASQPERPQPVSTSTPVQLPAAPEHAAPPVLATTVEPALRSRRPRSSWNAPPPFKR